MKRSLLGIDLKILPESERTGTNPWDKAKVLEANGWDTGLTVLDERDFDQFIEALKLDGGKTLLIRYQSPNDNRASWADRFTDKIDMIRGLRYPFVQITDWLDDLPAVYAQRRAKQLDAVELDMDRNFRRLAAAARAQGIETVMAPNCRFLPFGVRLYPRRMEARFDDITAMRQAKYQANPALFTWNQIAFVLGAEPGLIETVADWPDLYFNTSFEEAVLSNKALLYELDTLFPELEIRLRRFQPATTFWGCGLANQAGIRAWLRERPDAFFVRKPLAGSQGVGVRFLSKQVLLDGSGPHVEKEHAEAAYANLIVDLLSDDANIEERAVLVQTFVPSLPIWLDGRAFDGCARTILVCGRAVKSQWRCGASPLDSEDSSELKFRASLSMGSQAASMSAEHEEIAAAVGQAFSREFHRACSLLCERLSSHCFELFADRRIFAPAEQLRVLVYLRRLQQSAQGHIDLCHTIRSRLPKPLGEQVAEVIAAL